MVCSYGRHFVFLKYVKIYLSVEILVIENTLSNERNGIFINKNILLILISHLNILQGFSQMLIKYCSGLPK